MGGSVNDTLLENALNNRLTGGNGHNILLGLADRKKATYYLSGRIGLPAWPQRKFESKLCIRFFLAPSISDRPALRSVRDLNYVRRVLRRNSASSYSGFERSLAGNRHGLGQCGKDDHSR